MFRDSPWTANAPGAQEAEILVRDLPASIRALIEDAPFWKEVDAFAHIPKSSLETYAGRYVAVYEGTIVDSDHDEAILAERFYDNYGFVPVYIHKVGIEDDLVDASTRS